MAKKIQIDIEVNGKMQKATVDAKKLSNALNETGTNARNADRNLKGAAQASANGSKNFAKMAQGMTGSLVPAYAAVAAQVFALTALFNTLKNAADYKNLQAAQESYAASTGMAMQSITKNIKAASGAMLGYKEAAEAAAIGAAKGFTSSQMEQLAAGAGKAAAALGRNYQDSFDRLLRGVSKAEPELLDELGITLRLETATKNYATAIGTTADKLTAAQRSQAVYVETMKQLNANFGQVEQAVNPFQQLLVTFTELGQTVMGSVLGPLESLANFLNKNADAAAVAFSALIGMVLMNMPIIGEKISGVFTKAGDSGKKMSRRIFVPLKRQSQLAGRAVRDSLDKQIKKLEEVEIAALNAAEAQAGKTKGSAQKLLQDGVKSKSIQRVADNPLSLSPQQKGKLLKDIDDYIKKVKEGGDVTKSVFAGTTVEALEEFQDELRQTEKPVISLGDKIKKKLGKGAQKTIRATGTMLRFMGKGARFAGTMFKYLGKATIVIGVLSTMADVLSDLITRPQALIKSMIGMFSKIAKGLQTMGNIVVAIINKVLDQIPDKLLDLADLDRSDVQITKLTFADNIERDLTALANKGLEFAGFTGDVKDGKTRSPLEALGDVDEANKKLEAYNSRVDELKESFISTAQEANKLSQGIKTAIAEGEKSNIDIVQMRANALATLPLAAMLKEAKALQGTEREGEIQPALEKAFKDVDMSQFGIAFEEAFRSGNIKAMEEAAGKAAMFTASIAGMRDIMGNLSTTLSNNPLANRDVAKALLANAELADRNAVAMGRTTDAVGEADSAFKSGVQGYIDAVDALIAEEERLVQARAELQIDTVGTGRLNAAFKQEAGFGLQRRKAALDLQTKQNALATAELNLKETTLAVDSDGYIQLQKKLDQAQAAVDVAQETKNVIDETTTEMGRLGLTIGNSLTNSMTSAFDSLVQGTMTAKEAFASMAKSILADIAKMITKMLVMKLLQDSIGGTSFGNFLGIGNRYGGVMSDGEKAPGYATGGVAKGPQSGYPAVLHGTEAVVPLPNGKSIPVDMKGAGQNNNVTVNVAIDGQGNARQDTQATSNQGADLGAAVAAAVQKELQNQKRAGGILNPMGVS